MPAFSQVNSAMVDDLASYEAEEWSIIKTASLLSDSVDTGSFYTDHDLFSSSEIGYNPVYETSLKYMKQEVPERLEPIIPMPQQFNISQTTYQSKCIDQWQPEDCLFWLVHELQDLRVGQSLLEVKMGQIAHISGPSLKNMPVEEFVWMFPDHGMELYNRLQRYKANNFYSMSQWVSNTLRGDEPFLRPFPTQSTAPQQQPQETHTLTDLDKETRVSGHPQPMSHSHLHPISSLPFHSSASNISVQAEEESGYKSDSSEESVAEQPPPPEKRRPGRPRGTRKKKKPEKLGRLWEFIRDLLLNPLYNPSMICWENYEEGTFRFVHSDRVAKLWGSKKENSDMNYEKLSRAMRYYYKSQVLLPVYGKRLVYKFGPTATGWRSERPIFRQA